MTTANVSTLARNEFTSGKLITAILVVRVGSQTSGHFAASDRRHQSSVLPRFETAVNGASQDSHVITTLTSQVVCLLLVLVVEALIGGWGVGVKLEVTESYISSLLASADIFELFKPVWLLPLTPTLSHNLRVRSSLHWLAVVTCPRSRVVGCLQITSQFTSMAVWLSL